LRNDAMDSKFLGKAEKISSKACAPVCAALTHAAGTFRDVGGWINTKNGGRLQKANHPERYAGDGPWAKN
jgi:hypothetical protein